MARFPIGTFVETFLDQSKDDARRLIRHEMESMLDPLVLSLFKQLKDKFVHYLEDSSLSEYYFHQLAHDRGVDQHLIRDQQTMPNSQQNCYQYSLTNAHSMDANCQVNSSNHQTALTSIKEEIDNPSNAQLEQHQNESINSSSSTQESYLFPRSMIPSTSTGESLSNIDLMQPQPLILAHIKHNQFDDEDECDCDECADGGIELKEEDDKDDGQVDEESSRPVKRPKMDTTQEGSEDEFEMLSLQSILIIVSLAIETQSTFREHFQHNSDESMAIQQEERDANNAIGEEIATQYTTNPTQQNLAHPNRRFQCSQCLKSFDLKSTLQKHLRVHTGERPFQCDLCKKRFSERGNLTKHEQATHLHIKPYRCKQCWLTASKRSHVITHIRVVHFGLPKTFKEQQTLNIVDDRDPAELVEKV